MIVALPNRHSLLRRAYVSPEDAPEGYERSQARRDYQIPSDVRGTDFTETLWARTKEESRKRAMPAQARMAERNLNGQQFGAS